MNPNRIAYRALQHRLTRQALEAASPGLGILPLIGAVAGSGFELLKPWISGASKGETRAKEEVQRTLDYQGQFAAAQSAAKRNEQLAMLGAGVLIVGGAAYFLLRKRGGGGGKKRGRK